MLSALLRTCKLSFNTWDCVEKRCILYVWGEYALVGTITRIWAGISGVDSRLRHDIRAVEPVHKSTDSDSFIKAQYVLVTVKL
jgi:hypothetical protein